MKYSQFIIENYKGIDKITLDLTNNRIITLVGLNESGKTTIMEALKAFYELSRGRALTEFEKNTFRPKGIDFTGKIKLSANVEFESDDIKKISNYINSLSLPYQVIVPKNAINYSHVFEYNLHNFKEHNRYAIYDLKIKIVDETNKTVEKTLFDHDKDMWSNIVTYIRKELFPEIIYYEDFVFNIPEEITFNLTPLLIPTMANSTSINEKNSTWQLVLDDIIKVVNGKFSSFKEVVVDIWNTDNETALNRISQVEEILNKKITQSWKALFKKESKSVNFKEIKISTKTQDNIFRVSFKVKTDDGKLFSINDRSKGCRWFFSFLIFTEFRKNRTKNILFLLDEPASNLHSSAQSKILDAIKELSLNSVVIYSTHSHHLINPQWLAGAHIVINDKMSDEMLQGQMTFQDSSKVNMVKYFSYVGQGKGKTKVSYFQPILDALDYAPSFIEPIPNIVITEGKSDWYSFNYINDNVLLGKKINFYPGAGRDSLGDIIRLYLAWGKKFIVILDGDKPSTTSKNNYVKQFYPFLNDKIFTLKDILGINGSLEDLFESEDKEEIILKNFPKESFEKIAKIDTKVKDMMNSSLAQLSLKKDKIQLSEISKERFNKLFEFINKNLK